MMEMPVTEMATMGLPLYIVGIIVAGRGSRMCCSCTDVDKEEVCWMESHCG